MYIHVQAVHCCCLHHQTRLSQDNEHFLAAPNGLLYSEVTAGNLVKVDMGGQPLDTGVTGLGVNESAFSVHAAVHASRPDIKCSIQLRNTSAVSVSRCFVFLFASLVLSGQVNMRCHI